MRARVSGARWPRVGGEERQVKGSSGPGWKVRVQGPERICHLLGLCHRLIQMAMALVTTFMVRTVDGARAAVELGK